MIGLISDFDIIAELLERARERAKAKNQSYLDTLEIDREEKTIYVQDGDAGAVAVLFWFIEDTGELLSVHGDEFSL